MLCFRIYPVAIKFVDMRGRVIKVSRGRFFCLTVPKEFVEETFCDVFQKISVSEKAYG